MSRSAQAEWRGGDSQCFGEVVKYLVGGDSQCFGEVVKYLVGGDSQCFGEVVKYLVGGDSQCFGEVVKYHCWCAAARWQSSAMAWIRPDQVAGVSLGITGKGISSAMRQAQRRGVSA